MLLPLRTFGLSVADVMYNCVAHQQLLPTTVPAGVSTLTTT
jgi:hypothetical protein